MDNYTLDSDSIRRLAKTVRKVERMGKGRLAEGGDEQPFQGRTALVKCTSTTANGAGYYPGCFYVENVEQQNSSAGSGPGLPPSPTNYGPGFSPPTGSQYNGTAQTCWISAPATPTLNQVYVGIVSNSYTDSLPIANIGGQGGSSGFWARITGQATSAPLNVYSFEQIDDPTPPNGWVATIPGIAGTLCAEEVNGNTFVPADGSGQQGISAYVWMTPNPDKSGWYQFFSPQAAVAARYSNGNGTSVNSGIFTTIQCTTKEYDPSGRFYGASGPVAPVAGYYIGFAEVSGNGSPVFTGLSIGSSNGGASGEVSFASPGAIEIQSSWAGYLSEGEILQPEVLQDSGAAVNVYLDITIVLVSGSGVSAGVTAGVGEINGLSGSVTLEGSSSSGSGVGTTVATSGQTITAALTPSASAGINQSLASINI